DRGAAYFVDPIQGGGQLVARADLPREARERAVLVLRVDALRTRSGIVVAAERAGRRAVGVDRARDRFVHREQTARAEEPQLVFLNRSALRDVGVAVCADLVQRRDAVRVQEIVAVARLQALRLVAFEQRSAEAVAALFRNEIDLDAAGRRIDVAAAGLVHHFLLRAFVQLDLHGAVAL